MNTWQPISTAPKNTPILIRYMKNGKNYRTTVSGEWIVTQAKAKPIYFHEHPDGSYYSYYNCSPTPYGNTPAISTETEFVEWEDGLARLIVNTSSKKIINFVTHWMPLPPEPEDEVKKDSE